MAALISESSYQIRGDFVPLVSFRERDPRVQKLIDTSFAVHVEPLHQMMVDPAAQAYSYGFVGSRDYKFMDLDNPYCAAGMQASKMAAEFATQQRFAVLDVGTGNGEFLYGMKACFNNVDVLGISAIDFRCSKWGDQAITIPDDEYIVGNAENLYCIPALQGRQFHCIFSSMTVMHLSDPLGFIVQAYELLEEGGVFVCDSFIPYGLTGLEYVQALEAAGCDAKIFPEKYGLTAVDGVYPRLDFTVAEQTMIRKKSPHLMLPIGYDLRRCRQATREEKAGIVYTA